MTEGDNVHVWWIRLGSVMLSLCNLQDALSDVGSTFQMYSQKASSLIGSRSQGSESMQAADNSFEQLPSGAEASEPDADSTLPSSSSAQSQETSATRTS